jgi:hypothetical protein
MRYRLRTLLIVTVIVATYFGGRASTAPRISKLEELTTRQGSEIKGLGDENERLKGILDAMMKSVGTRPPRKPGGLPLQTKLRESHPAKPAGLSEAEPGVYFLAPINR